MTCHEEEPPAGKSGGHVTTESSEHHTYNEDKSYANKITSSGKPAGSTQGSKGVDGPQPESGKEVRQGKGLLPSTEVQGSSEHEDTDGWGCAKEEEVSPEEVIWYYFWGQPSRSQMPKGYDGEYRHLPADWDEEDIIKSVCETWADRFVGPTNYGMKYGWEKKNPPPDIAEQMIEDLLKKAAKLTREVALLIPHMNATETCPECGAFMKFSVVSPDQWNKIRHRYEFAERKWMCAQCGKTMAYDEVDTHS